MTELAQRAVASVIGPGDLVVDATAGNGHDTLFLSRTVGPSGRVWAFDVQTVALAGARRLLESQGGTNVSWIHACHSSFPTGLPGDVRGRLAAVMFNLGYLPGADRAVVTRADSTCAALVRMVEWLRPTGIITVLMYVGHPGGADEARAVKAWADTLERGRFDCTCHVPPAGRLAPPELLVIRAIKSRGDDASASNQTGA